MKNRIITFFLLIITIAFPVELPAQKLVPIIVNADKPKAGIKPTMWGIFFEDINFGADGGIYAELVKNRSFEFYRPRTGWKNMLQDNKPLTGQQGLYATAAVDERTKEIILKVVNTTSKIQTNNIVLQTSKKISLKAKKTVLKNATLDGLNTIDNPESIKPVDEEFTLKGKNVNLAVDPYSFTVVIIKMQ